MENLIGQVIGGYEITENVNKAFEILNNMSEKEIDAFFGLLSLRAQIEQQKTEEMIKDLFKPQWDVKR